jgi:hypothetical protein
MINSSSVFDEYEIRTFEEQYSAFSCPLGRKEPT